MVLFTYVFFFISVANVFENTPLGEIGGEVGVWITIWGLFQEQFSRNDK